LVASVAPKRLHVEVVLVQHFLLVRDALFFGHLEERERVGIDRHLPAIEIGPRGAVAVGCAQEVAFRDRDLRHVAGHERKRHLGHDLQPLELREVGHALLNEVCNSSRGWAVAF
jgi:hypothetical protein